MKTQENTTDTSRLNDVQRFFLYESRFAAAETMARLRGLLAERGIPLFAEFDHAKNAVEAGLKLRPTTVFVFGSPKVGTALMQAEQLIALELPLRIVVWEDEGCHVWLAFKRTVEMAEDYGMASNQTLVGMQGLLEDLVSQAGGSPRD
jgi:uncharacterized protein (DUF302 family)